MQVLGGTPQVQKPLFRLAQAVNPLVRLELQGKPGVVELFIEYGRNLLDDPFDSVRGCDFLVFGIFIHHGPVSVKFIQLLAFAFGFRQKETAGFIPVGERAGLFADFHCELGQGYLNQIAGIFIAPFRKLALEKDSLPRLRRQFFSLLHAADADNGFRLGR